jgi:ribosomal protein L20
MQQWHKKQIISLTEYISGKRKKFYRSMNVTVTQATNYIARPMQQRHNKQIMSLTEGNSGTRGKLYCSPNATVTQ